MGPQSGAAVLSVITELPWGDVIACSSAYPDETEVVPQHRLEDVGYTYHLFASCI